MPEKPKITPEIIEEVESAIAGKGKIGLKKLVSQIQGSEPHLWEWLRRSSHEDVAGLMQKGLTMYPDVTEFFGGLFIKSRLIGFLLAEAANDKQWMEKHSINILDDSGSVSEDLEKKFDSWIAGELDAAYYQFPEPNAKLHPNKALALSNFKKKQEQIAAAKSGHEERIRKSAEIRMVEKEAGISEPDSLPPGVTRVTKRKLTDELDHP